MLWSKHDWRRAWRLSHTEARRGDGNAHTAHCMRVPGLKKHTHRCVHNVSNKDVFNETAMNDLLNGKIMTLLHFYIML